MSLNFKRFYRMLHAQFNRIPKNENKHKTALVLAQRWKSGCMLVSSREDQRLQSSTLSHMEEKHLIPSSVPGILKQRKKQIVLQGKIEVER